MLNPKLVSEKGQRYRVGPEGPQKKQDSVCYNPIQTLLN